MGNGHDFGKAKRGAVVPQGGKTRIGVHIDDEILAVFRSRADALNSGGGYLGTLGELPYRQLVILHLLDQKRREVDLALLLVDAPADRRVLCAIQGANVALWFVHHSNTP